MSKKANTAINCDVLILGAGINGTGIALELSKTGEKVVVLERSTIGSGTSSKSSRLIHGGLRYLEQFQFKLVREALLDRQELLQTYPDLVKMKIFYLPVYRSNPRSAWTIWVGLKLYDLLAGKHNSHKSSIVPRETFTTREPHLMPEGLRAVFQYHDAKTNDLELTRRIAREARRNNARFFEHINVNTISHDRKQFTVITDQGSFRAPTLINATGPWIDEVNDRYELPAHYHIRKISGIHIILDGLLTQDFMFMQTHGKRIFFIIPEHENNHTLIGTTEREETGPVDTVRVKDEDIQYLINNINVYLKPEYHLTLNDVADAFIGVRPLVAHKDTPTDLSREYKLDLIQFGSARLLHVFGGKLTTFLSLSRKVNRLLHQ